MVHGNGRNDDCLALNTSRGAYTVVSATERFDSVLGRTGSSFDRGGSGIRVHGAPTDEFLFTLGDRVTIVGEIDDTTSYGCSRYHDLAIIDVRRP